MSRIRTDTYRLFSPRTSSPCITGIFLRLTVHVSSSFPSNERTLLTLSRRSFVSFVVCRSPFVVRRMLFAVRRMSFVARRSSMFHSRSSILYTRPSILHSRSSFPLFALSSLVKPRKCFSISLHRENSNWLCTVRCRYQQLAFSLSDRSLFSFTHPPPFPSATDARFVPLFDPLTDLYLSFLFSSLPVSRYLFIFSATANTISTERSPRRRYCAGKENEYFMETDRYWGVHYRYCPLLRIDLKEGRRASLRHMQQLDPSLAIYDKSTKQLIHDQKLTSDRSFTVFVTAAAWPGSTTACAGITISRTWRPFSTNSFRRKLSSMLP